MKCKLIGIWMILPLLGSCVGTDPSDLRPWEENGVEKLPSVSAEVKDKSHNYNYGPALTPGAPYLVVDGDTLYSIAFRLGLDFRELAKYNQIISPYTIFVGQRLITSGGLRVVTKSNKEKKLPALQKKNKELAHSSKTLSSKNISGRNEAVGGNNRKLSTTVKRWLWPSSGFVERRYSAQKHKGIDIVGQRGDDVRATANGYVVYAGIGLKGYGKLLIVKHNQTYLSAYGHNESLLVVEGEEVDAGQRIAKMGSSGTDSVKLHFEIRKLGVPIDPLSVLPVR